MTRIFFSLLLGLLLSACGTVDRTVPVAEIPKISPDYEIEDVRMLPQDFRAYAPSPNGYTFIDSACRETLLAEFMQRYFAPWNGNEPLSNISGAVKSMNEHAAREWYGSNRRKVPAAITAELLANCDLERFPSMQAMAVAIEPTAMRVLPTARPLFETPDDFPFDALQNAGLKMNEPVRVLHTSTDGIWAFAETADANGWVPLRDLGFIDERMAEARMSARQVVIVKDFALIRDRREQLALRAKTGTILPLAGETGDAFEVSLAAKSGISGVQEITVKVAKDTASRFPLAVNGENAVLVGNELIGLAYGWGELFQGRDCSSLMRDFFLPFGIWLPRGSFNQINSGKIISLAGLTPTEKEQLIREKGVPFLTLIHLRGHIMLYVGSRDGKALIFHSLWKVKVKNGEGRVVKRVVGKAIISTLIPGRELPLAADGSLLEKVSSMLVLGSRCAANQ